MTKTLKRVLLPLTLASFLVSCATPVSKADPDYERIVSIVRATVGDQDQVIRCDVTIRGDSAIARYVVSEPLAQHVATARRKATLVKTEGIWVLHSKVDDTPWSWRFK